jgi:hypothetical protein
VSQQEGGTRRGRARRGFRGAQGVGSTWQSDPRLARSVVLHDWLFPQCMRRPVRWQAMLPQYLPSRVENCSCAPRVVLGKDPTKHAAGIG